MSNLETYREKALKCMHAADEGHPLGERVGPADTAGMAKKPEPPKPLIWNVYKIAKKAVWLGAGEAPDKRAAVEKAAKEFKTEVWRLYAVGRR